MADQECALASQPLRDGIDAISALDDRRFNQTPGAFSNVAVIVENAGHRCGRDAGQLRHIFEGRLAPPLGSHFGHDFNAPAVIPSIKRRWSRRKSTTIGNMEMVTPAAIIPRSAVKRPKKNIVPRETGRSLSRCTNTSGIKNWF